MKGIPNTFPDFVLFCEGVIDEEKENDKDNDKDEDYEVIY